MTPQEARDHRAKLDERRALLAHEKDRLDADYRLLGRLCPHPDATTTSHMGESCRDCPDCGMCV